MPQADSYKRYGALSKSSYQMPQRETEPWLHLSDNGGQKLLSLRSFSADANCPQQSRRQERDLTQASLQIVRAVRERFAWPCQSPRHIPQLHYTNKHLKHSPQNKIGSICGCCVPCRRCQTSAEHHSTLCLFQFYCLSYVRWGRICDLQANKNLIRGFGPRDVIDWGMTRWLPTEPMDQ